MLSLLILGHDFILITYRSWNMRVVAFMWTLQICFRQLLKQSKNLALYLFYVFIVWWTQFFNYIVHPEKLKDWLYRYPDEDAGQVPAAFVVRKLGSKVNKSHIMEFVAKQVSTPQIILCFGIYSFSAPHQETCDCRWLHIKGLGKSSMLIHYQRMLPVRFWERNLWS